MKELLDKSKGCSSSGCIKGKDGSILLTQDQILDRWSEYIEDLFRDERGEKPNIRKNMDGPEITTEEVKAAIKNMKTGKSPGPDEIAVEMIKALDEFGVTKVTELANKIYQSGSIPDDLSKSVFIALPKQPGAIECELHRTISLMSHITKIILQILIRRMRRSISPVISNTQCGYVKDRGTRNAVFMLRILTEKCIEKHRPIFMLY